MYKKIRIIKDDSDTIKIDKSQLFAIDSSLELEYRRGGDLMCGGFILPSSIHGFSVKKWIMGEDSIGNLCIVPLKNI